MHGLKFALVPFHFSTAVRASAFVGFFGLSGACATAETDVLRLGASDMGDGLLAVDLGSNASVKAIAAGAGHSCAILGDGAVKCWGDNEFGQLGLGDTRNRGDDPDEMGDALPTVDLGGWSAVAISAGAAHTCAILDNGSVKCWGIGDARLGTSASGNRGDSPFEMGDSLPAVSLGVGRTAKAVAAGQARTCAVLDDGSVQCWGSNVDGELGIGSKATMTKGAVQLGSQAATVVVGWHHACALVEGGAVKCWGTNREGELGSEDKMSRGASPADMGNGLPVVNLGQGATALASTWTHTCAILDDGAVKCWGNNSSAELGVGDANNRGSARGEMGDALPPVDLGAGRTARAIAAGTHTTCAVLDNGAVKCWGTNFNGTLGIGGASDKRGDDRAEMGDALPVINLGKNRTAKAIASATTHRCALLDNNRVKCWGENSSGQLGQGDTTARGFVQIVEAPVE
jgi:alpha-tubulin suppressor-like RCC1 family protein